MGKDRSQIESKDTSVGRDDREAESNNAEFQRFTNILGTFKETMLYEMSSLKKDFKGVSDSVNAFDGKLRQAQNKEREVNDQKTKLTDAEAKIRELQGKLSAKDGELREKCGEIEREKKDHYKTTKLFQEQSNRLEEEQKLRTEERQARIPLETEKIRLAKELEEVKSNFIREQSAAKTAGLKANETQVSLDALKQELKEAKQMMATQAGLEKSIWPEFLSLDECSYLKALLVAELNSGSPSREGLALLASLFSLTVAINEMRNGSGTIASHATAVHQFSRTFVAYTGKAEDAEEKSRIFCSKLNEIWQEILRIEVPFFGQPFHNLSMTMSGQGQATVLTVNQVFSWSVFNAKQKIILHKAEVTG